MIKKNWFWVKRSLSHHIVVVINYLNNCVSLLMLPFLLKMETQIIVTFYVIAATEDLAPLSANILRYINFESDLWILLINIVLLFFTPNNWLDLLWKWRCKIYKYKFVNSNSCKNIIPSLSLFTNYYVSFSFQVIYYILLIQDILKYAI